MKTNIFLLFCLFYVSSIYAQEHEHEHARNEIGFGGVALYSFGDESWGSGAHLHYFRTLGLHSKWSLGGGIEQVWCTENHFTVGAGVKYELFNRLSLGVIPGVTFFSHNEANAHHQHEQRKTQFSTHFELIYELFYFSHFHLGPVLDYSLTKNDSHAALGIHAAFCF